jgi:selenide, water dikinase
VLRRLFPVDDPAVLVDASTADDAAVYRLDGDRALVVTADFFTPIVDDPYDFGRIAAANALSDVYAMGARPLLALNLVAFPRALLDRGILEEIVRGGGEVARWAGAAVLGGHSIDDAEPKYGLCVVGEVRPDDVVRNSTARAGDALVLTKPLGTGVIATAIKAGAAPADVVATAVASMTALNRAASEAMRRHGVTACTDVTGYGLLGHLGEMLRASGLAARLHAAAVPLLPGAAALAAAGHIPGGTRRNRDDAEGMVDWDDGVPDLARWLLADAQTSGGLLIALPRDRAGALVAELAGALDALGERVDPADPGGPTAPAIVGELLDGPAGQIQVAP